MKKIVLAGNGITADILYQYMSNDERYEIVDLVVDDAYVDTGRMTEFKPAVPLSKLQDTHVPADCSVIMAMGYADLNRGRQSMFSRLKDMGYMIETYIHHDARVYTQNPIGEGAVILPFAIIEPHASVGENTMVWCHSTVAHHASIGDHCWIASGTVIAGQSRVGDNCFIGVNATIVNERTIGACNVIGAGAVITKDTEASSVYLSRSAEKIRFSAEDYVKHFGM